jgi:hypothetical protein
LRCGVDGRDGGGSSAWAPRAVGRVSSRLVWVAPVRTRCAVERLSLPTVADLQPYV